MTKSFTLWALMAILFCACSPQPYFFSSIPNTQASSSLLGQQEPENAPIPEAQSPALASLGEAPIAFHQPSPVSVALARYAAPKKHVSIPIQVLAKQEKQQAATQLPDDGKEKKHSKFGKLGHLLSWIGLGTLVLGLVASPFFTLGFLALTMGTIFSALALSEIKKAPEQYLDRRKAKTGLVVGIVGLSLYLLITLIIVAAIVALMAGGAA